MTLRQVLTWTTYLHVGLITWLLILHVFSGVDAAVVILAGGETMLWWATLRDVKESDSLVKEETHEKS